VSGHAPCLLIALSPSRQAESSAPDAVPNPFDSISFPMQNAWMAPISRSLRAPGVAHEAGRVHESVLGGGRSAVHSFGIDGTATPGADANRKSGRRG
jgi:hypothetical protein